MNVTKPFEMLRRPLWERLAAVGAILSLALPAALHADNPKAENKAQFPDLRVLVVSGGPQPQHNQVAIENNVRYFLKLLPDRLVRTVLFADGDRQRSTVLFEEPGKALSREEKIVALAVKGREAVHLTSQKYRPPSIPQLDGAAKKADVSASFEKVRQEYATNPRPLLLYFTGHGSQARNRDLENNVFDLWGETLSVRELAAQIAALPAEQSVTIVMVQCFSGAFGNLLFENGDPQGNPIGRDLAGFYATVKERVAAGCTPELDEKEYHDFTSYFFAALTGRDRVGRVVSGADYNHDGKVGMNEAFCYTLVNDVSIDIPVCTSDIFLRRFVKTPDDEVFKATYRQVLSWASPAQAAALEGLSRSLGYRGEARLQEAYQKFRSPGGNNGTNPAAAARRTFSTSREEVRKILLERYPILQTTSRELQAPGYTDAYSEAIKWVASQSNDSRFKDLLDADAALDALDKGAYHRELDDSRLTRFVRLAKSIVLAHTLREGDDETLKRRFAQLIEAESRPLLPPADARRFANR